jgi:mannose-6-phosphate isomerase-like protein (cupin superfamily)
VNGKDTVEGEEKVWGRVMHIFTSTQAGVSYLEVNKGFQCSRHYHKQRVNAFAVISGKLLILEWDENGKQSKEEVLISGQVYSIPVLVEHRFCVLESGIVVEYYSPGKPGDKVDITDIVRRDVGGKIPLQNYWGY